MSLIESILYGLVSGITEFLPVSSRAHQSLMLYLFGMETRASLQELLVHIGVLLAIVLGCREVLNRLRREQRNTSVPRRRRHGADNRSTYELRLLKTASVPLFIGLFLRFATVRWESNLLLLLLFWLINGIILLLADHTSRGNRDSRTMSSLDGIVMGIFGALSAFPGISRTGMISSYTTARGVSNENVADWSILLGVPAMLFAGCFDFICIFGQGLGVGSFMDVLFAILSGVAAFIGAHLGISLLKFLLNQSGLSKFAYYSMGAALFSFILYLIT